ncbi:hypothetical protein HYFRA_00003200 [Hymenoscyphus fraxineus]|uniref:Alpha-L-rhamnosidase six-hairpin glycosidase domain-containing protein n=1 Tax=Hymenoscyphus fraxineus TaxID=746836 RepID=A0A9N9KUR9_9HELO|nr:hypothetical protein HYFRA_00003200 [Hymenoscyphus fraxineus]
MTPLLSLFCLLTSVGSVLSEVPYSEYILAPSTRTLYPEKVYNVNGSISNPETLLGGPRGNAIFNGVSAITFDFLKNIGGVVSITVESSTDPSAVLGLTYTESNLWIAGDRSDGTGDDGPDEVIFLPAGEPGHYTVERRLDRGAFRYLSVVSNSPGTIRVSQVSVWYTAAPVQELREYAGWFHTNDELLNRIWYAGAYTNQLCTIDPKWGNALGRPNTPNDTTPDTQAWWSNDTITEGRTTTTDGAKRDRQVWPGDMAIGLPSIFVSTNDWESPRNGLTSLLALQSANGMLPWAGYPFNERGVVSFTYHLYTLIGISYYYEYFGDLEYLKGNWGKFTKGMEWSLSYIDDTGLMNVTSSADWLRVGMGGHNVEANSILYYTLNKGIALAKLLNDTTKVDEYTPIAAKIKTVVNELLWNPDTNLYIDNETTTLSPQDGNAWAVKANITTSTAQSANVTRALTERWGTLGAPAPEAGGSPPTISPFIGSFELEAHFLGDETLDALELIRRQWGFMIDDPRMTNSTFIEGFSSDGSLHYQPYRTDSRVSHAHGWSTGPTYLMSFYIGGIHMESSIGKTWSFRPLVGDLKEVDSGYQTPLGTFSSKYSADGKTITAATFSTPEDTVGTVTLQGVEGTLVSGDQSIDLVDGKALNVPGGTWDLRFLK